MEVKPISNNQLKYLSFQKVIPRDNYHDISVHKYYIYCYLDPFRSGEYHFKIMGKPFTFGYEPVYVGKASSAHGYRHNQHIAEFLKGFDSEEPSSPSGITMSYNITKYNTFTEIDKQMKLEQDMINEQTLKGLSYEQAQCHVMRCLYIDGFSGPTFK